MKNKIVCAAMKRTCPKCKEKVLGLVKDTNMCSKCYSNYKDLVEATGKELAYRAWRDENGIKKR